MKGLEENIYRIKDILINAVKNAKSLHLEWLLSKAKELEKNGVPSEFYKTFSLVPKIFKEEFSQKCEEGLEINGIKTFDWTIGDLARSLILLSFPHTDKKIYSNVIITLFQTGDVNELRLLYKVLALLPHPQVFVQQASEGVRSNMTSIFESIAFNNTFPYLYFEEKAWNQMVLKAIFIEKPISGIYKLDSRRNMELCRMVIDLANERWAAGRTINSEAWRLVAPFINKDNVNYLHKLMQNGSERDKKAVILACHQNGNEDALKLLDQFPEFTTNITKEFSWEQL